VADSAGGSRWSLVVLVVAASTSFSNGGLLGAAWVRLL
jgi:hypothetical protein